MGTIQCTRMFFESQIRFSDSRGEMGGGKLFSRWQSKPSGSTVVHSSKRRHHRHTSLAVAYGKATKSYLPGGSIQIGLQPPVQMFPCTESFENLPQNGECVTLKHSHHWAAITKQTLDDRANALAKDINKTRRTSHSRILHCGNFLPNICRFPLLSHLPEVYTLHSKGRPSWGKG